MFSIPVDAVVGASLTVTPSAGPVAGIQVSDVGYDPPSQGLVTFGWNAPLVVEGQEIPIQDYPRIDNPRVTVERGDSSWEIEGGGKRVFLEWALEVRAVGAAVP